jgi:hypothetical protein
MVVSGCRLHLIAAAQHVLPNQLHRHVRIARLGEVTETGSANESAFALWIEPAYCLTIRYDWREWRSLIAALAALSATLLLSLSLTLSLPATTTALSASALIATATPIVAIIAVAITLVLSLSALTTAAPALLTHRLRVVLRLLLRLSGVFAAVADGRSARVSVVVGRRRG